jgi:hypothetical protein
MRNLEQLARRKWVMFGQYAKLFFKRSSCQSTMVANLKDTTAMVLA